MNEYDHDLSVLRIDTPPVTLRAMALERLRQAIISGVFKPGQRLVERMLCDQLGVSRSVIREVIRHLDAEGLVTTEGQGPMVSRLAWDDARQIYEIRAALEAAAVEACARVADDAVKATLQAAVEAIERYAAKGDWMAVLEATEQFYGTIFATGGHPIAGESSAASMAASPNSVCLLWARRTARSPGRAAFGIFSRRSPKTGGGRRRGVSHAYPRGMLDRRAPAR